MYLKHDACIYKWACVSLFALIIFYNFLRSLRWENRLYHQCTRRFSNQKKLWVSPLLLIGPFCECYPVLTGYGVVVCYNLLPNQQMQRDVRRATFEKNHRCASETYRNINVEVICRYRLMLEQKLKVDFASYFGIKGL